MIRSIFLYLDRTYAVPSTSLLSIWYVCHPSHCVHTIVESSLVPRPSHTAFFFVAVGKIAQLQSCMENSAMGMRLGVVYIVQCL